jgi:predicted tellurium resistance membrane protein TerC
MAELLSTDLLLAFLTLAALEIVLGVDNLVFIAILAGKLPEEQQAKARRLGLILAALGRIVLLFMIAWVVSLDKSVLFSVGEKDISIKDLILVIGGAFLIGKATWEIHHKLEAALAAGTEKEEELKEKISFKAVITQVVLLDLVFSIDSVLTAVGMVDVDPTNYESGSVPLTGVPWPPMVVMCGAVILAIAVMLGFAGPLSRFIERHPTLKMLALAFLLLIGVVLVAEGMHFHIPRGYIYFAMGFSLLVSLLNMKLVSNKLAKAEARQMKQAEANG